MLRKLSHWLFVLVAISFAGPLHAQNTQGAAANGSPVKGNPVLIGGSDGTNARTLKTDSTGQLYIANPGSGGGGGGSTSTTTYPVSPLSNAAGTTGISLYSDTLGYLLSRNYQGGTWTVAVSNFPATQPVSIASLPALTAGSAAIGTVGVTSLPSLPAGSNTIGTVGISGTVPVSGSFWQSVQPVSGTFWPYTLGQQISASSVPVVLPAAQITALTPPTTITANQGGAWNVGITGTPTVTANAGSGSFTVVQATGTNLHTTVDNTVSVSGTVTATNPANGPPASAAPSSATYVAGTDGTNLRGIGVNASNQVAIQAPPSLPLPTGAATSTKQPSLGTAGSASADVLTVQGIAGGTAVKTDGSGVTQPISAASLPLPTSAATDASVTGLQVSQGSTTSGQKGELIQGAVTTAAPTYTTGQSSPLSLDTTGALRITGSISASNPSVGTTGSAVPGSATYLAGIDGSGNLKGLVLDASGRPTVNVNGTVTTSGTVTANIGTSGSLALDATLTGGTQKTQIVSSGGNAAAIDSSGNQAVKGGFTEVSGSASALNADLIASMDVSAHKSLSVHITAQASGGITTFQGSNDNSNWFSVSLLSISTTQGAPISAASTTGLYFGPISFRYLRIRETSWTSGTASLTAELYTSPVSPVAIGGQVIATSTQSGTWTVQQGSTPSATPWAVNPVAATTGGYSYSNITTATTTTVKSGSGYLHTLTVGTGGSGSTATVYDSTTGSGTKIGTFDTSATRTIAFDLQFSTGLTIVTTSTAPDLTITYK